MSAKTLYNHLKSSADIPIRCPICSERMTVNHFYWRHALENHRFQSRKQCMFCKGLKSRAHGEKIRPNNLKHVVECLKRCVIVAGDESPGMQDEEEEEEEKEEEVASADACECKKFESTPHQMFGRCKERMNEYVGFYDSVFENPDWWRSDEPVEFTEASGLAEVYGILQRFTWGDLDWFHNMVKHDAFETFFWEMEKIRNQFVLLLFWCLCDGMVSGTSRTQHRHMIVACELESSFKDIWQYKIRYKFLNSGRAKKCVKIQDAFHLARVIVYVNQRKAGCDGWIPKYVTDLGQLSHFHMNRQLREHSIAFLCTLFPGWIQKLFVDQNGKKNVFHWETESIHKRDQWYNKQWKVPIRVMGWKFINCVIPLDRRYEPSEEHTPVYLSLHGSKKLYLKWRNMEQDVNWAFQSIRDEPYVLSRKQQQNVMNQIKETKMALEALWKYKVAEGNT
ncbi:uncharacterized protein NPIL_519221 [Nephila pilipes]|uniref:Uncharacterized protein n=1 Tax=Nephila pilipes TaxID=299642 RepID=A0A8X6NG73_NEPPI|nr:uncharacterized protein NPIL_519221 [Nephila pilipes]